MTTKKISEITEILKNQFTFPDMFGFYLSRNQEIDELELTVVQESTKHDVIKYVIIEKGSSYPILREAELLDLHLKGKKANLGCADEKELQKRIELIKSINL